MEFSLGGSLAQAQGLECGALCLGARAHSQSLLHPHHLGVQKVRIIFLTASVPCHLSKCLGKKPKATNNNNNNDNIELHFSGML